MTRAVRDRVLKDVNGNISDHLRNHIHLTNCIHLKNHMHKQSPALTDRALMRELVVLQRSRSLKDPSASPPSWKHSPGVVDMLLKRGERDGFVNGRRSVGLERSNIGEWMTVHSLPAASAPVIRHNDEMAVGTERISENGIREQRKGKKEVSNASSVEHDAMLRHNDDPGEGNDRANGSRDRKLKNVLVLESDDAASTNNHENVRDPQAERISLGNNTLSRARRRRFRAVRRNRPAISTTRDPESQNEISVTQNDLSMACNSFAQGNARNFQEEDRAQEYNEEHVNGCGVQWNWSKIHNRGKSILDLAGRSLSCGLSESRLKTGNAISRRRDIADMAVLSEYTSSSCKSEAEVLPLLFEASGSQRSVDHAAWLHDYSGELGVYADNLLKQETDDSELVSEGRSHEKHRSLSHRNKGHQNLTQRYMPRTFRDLVGQNLVVQALSNAIERKKVGLLYVFHGPNGTGKTSCARVFARALNCQSQEHPKPCGFCNTCVAHDMGKSRHIKEVGPVGNVNFESVIELLDKTSTTSHHHQSMYKVFIFDECDTLSSDCWSAMMKVIDRAPRRVAFILVCSGLDALPHVIMSRCQKFFFPKLKDADIIYTLQRIASKEDLDIHKDALKLIASRSDGSLRDAEMTLEQLSLLGQRISLGLVQELVGLISDEKLVDLLDLALSADTVNTVKNLRDIMESGVEPLALMSQLATVITDILAGSYDFLKDRPRRKFFRRQALSKDDMEKLRQALKTLSEAEKQLRVSNDRITWLTAALLQLAPDQQYMLPSSSGDASFIQSPLVLQNAAIRERPRKSNAEIPTFQAGTSRDAFRNGTSKGVGLGEKRGHIGEGSSHDKKHVNNVQVSDKSHQGVEELWLEMLKSIRYTNLREFMYKEGKLSSVSYGAAPTVELMFNTETAKSRAEKIRSYLIQSFESVFESPVTLEMRSTESAGEAKRSEIVEIAASPKEMASKQKTSVETSFPNEKGLGDRNPSLSIVRGKVSLAHVIQQTDGTSQHNGWSRRKAVSIAEKLEQENLRLEPKSRGLLCWNRPPRGTRRKVSRLKIRTKRPQALLKFVSCGRCLSSRSPR